MIIKLLFGIPLAIIVIIMLLFFIDDVLNERDGDAILALFSIVTGVYLLYSIFT